MRNTLPLTLFQALGAALAIAAMIALAAWSHVPLIAAPFTTSIVLVMGAPESPPAQPLAIIGGHLVSIVAGLAVVHLLGDSVWLAAPAVGLALLGMKLTGTFHPPAGINALIAVTQHLSWEFALMPVLAGAILLAAFAWCWHGLARRFYIGSA